MADAVTKLMDRWRKDKVHAVGNLAERLRCADDVARLNREVIEPMAVALRRITDALVVVTGGSIHETWGSGNACAVCCGREALYRYYGEPEGTDAQDSK